MPSHSTNIINQPSSHVINITYDDKVEEANHVVNHVESQLQPLVLPSTKPQPSLATTFDHSNMFKVPNDPL